MAPFHRGLGILLLSLCCALGSCAGGEGAQDKAPHILLISTAGLRADMLGTPLTPHLDALHEQHGWSGTMIAASSATVPATASLLTGLPPWRHQALFGGATRLDSRLVTMAEALAAEGYRTEAWTEGHWLQYRRGGHQGFADHHRLRRDKRLLRRLNELTQESSDAEPLFLWLHLDQPKAPYTRRPGFATGTSPQLLRALPARLEAQELAPYRDPALPLPNERQDEVRAMYRQAVGWTDFRIGRFLEALSESGYLDRFLIVVTSVHGQTLGDDGPVGYGNDLARAAIEVPVLIRQPLDRPARKLFVEPGIPTSQMRLWATVVETGGGSTPPAVPPSLYQEAYGGALSELYLTNGFNLFSWVDEDGYQLVRRTPFAAPEPEYYSARLKASAQSGERDAIELQEAPRRIFRRLDRAFQRTPPFTGNGQSIEFELHRWTEGRSVQSEQVDDAAILRQMELELDTVWHAFLDREQTPAEEKRAWN